MKVLLVSTTTNERRSSSRAVLSMVERFLKASGHEIQYIDANKLHIIKNLSCYADGGRQCADPESGPYRCWAHKHGEEEPEKYGGRDEMPQIYDGLMWCDAVIWATSVRWGNHTALMQTIIERMNTLENRHSVYGEDNPLWDKRCGVIVTGQHWKSAEVANRLIEVFNLYGFKSSASGVLSWQAEDNMDVELEDNNTDIVKLQMREERFAPVVNLIKAMNI
jgi:multimeric flavodoxin WrbA